MYQLIWGNADVYKNPLSWNMDFILNYYIKEKSYLYKKCCISKFVHMYRTPVQENLATMEWALTLQ